MTDVAQQDLPPEPDRIEGAPHPRETTRIFGQDAAIASFLQAYGADRLHHGWLLTGPRGVGKATLAWAIARFLLTVPLPRSHPGATAGLFDDAPAAAPPTTLDVDPDHPVVRRMQARSEPGVFHVTRSPHPNTGRLRDVIAVDDIRGISRYLSMRAAEGGRRVVIVDAADEMNVNAANALLKILEEPPALTTLLLIAHQPQRLLPTIRSRCRTLALAPLDAPDMARALAQAGLPAEAEAQALAALAAGSVGQAIRLFTLDGPAIYAELAGLMANAPGFDRTRALALADAAAQRGAEERRDLLFILVDLFLARLARTGATGHLPPVEACPGEADILRHLSPDPACGRAWATAAQEISGRVRHGLAVNLDPAALVLDTVFRMSQTARP